ncbi:hypothetical protein AWH48_08420 [Domibacillus aminovorans]|uniref:YviE n=1 Tax=Domibacillus aminovorans TaxID=29332 RepID=A0A177KNP4_9BACI|nr:DUF6470 family protein [Domibacillus aminovorans]OAH54606.1 hypothetical protein AWH48_08420 [Domibacillus aminovorans]
MNISMVQIHTTKAQLGMTTTPSRLSIEQPQATVDIRQPKAEMNITTTPGKLSIDQTQAWADMDRKHIFQRIKEAASEGRQKALEGTGRRAAEGRELADIHKGGNAIAMQAARSNTRNYETGLAWVPSHGSVKINYEPGDVRIDAQARPVENHTRANKPIINYQPGSVKVQLKQYPSIDFQVVNKTI